MDEFEIEIKQTFLEQAQQLLEEAEGAFIALDSGDRSKSLLDKIFRLAHSFKGSARAVGFQELAKFAHEMEEVLTLITRGQVEPDRAVCSVLLAALDVLKAYVAGLKKDLNFELDTAEVVSEFKKVRAREGGEPERSSGSEPEIPVTHDPSAVFVSSTSSAAPSAPVAPSASARAEEGAAIARKPVPGSSTAQAEEEAIRVPKRKLDSLLNFVGELVVTQSMLTGHRATGTIGGEQALSVISYLEKLVSELHDLAMSLRMVPVKPLFQRMKRTLRDVATVQNKDVELHSEGEHVELDKTVIDRISDPLTHLLRNAVDHGIEDPDEREKSGKPRVAKVVLSAEQREDHVLITVADDGRGMDKAKIIKKGIEKGLVSPSAQLSDEEAYALIFHSGFSTRESVTDISGRGVGMDVVRRAVDELKGSIAIHTKLGAGTEFKISLPLSLSMITGLVVSVDQRKYVVPVNHLVEIIDYRKLKVETSTGSGRMVNLRGQVMPVLSLSHLLHAGTKGKASHQGSKTGVVTQLRGRKWSFEIDEILGQQQIVLKSLGREMSGLPGVIAGAILSSGEPGLILNLHDLVPEEVSHVA